MFDKMLYKLSPSYYIESFVVESELMTSAGEIVTRIDETIYTKSMIKVTNDSHKKNFLMSSNEDGFNHWHKCNQLEKIYSNLISGIAKDVLKNARAGKGIEKNNNGAYANGKHIVKCIGRVTDLKFRPLSYEEYIKLVKLSEKDGKNEKSKKSASNTS